MMSKKQRGGLHYDMNKGTNFRGGDEKVDKLLVIVLPLKRVKVFVEYKCLMQQEILEQHLQLFTVVFEMISSLFLELYLQLRSNNEH